MVNAELIHNPYLLQTSVKFNGQVPRINSQVEKYDTATLKDWIEKVPQIFYDEMNGYDFDLFFTGTKSDFESLQNTFAYAGITHELVRLFHKNELEDAETKSDEIDNLIQWLNDHPNRKFNFEEFFSANYDLFEGAYPYIIINGHAVEKIHPHVSMESIKDVAELKDTDLTNTPILFFIDPSLRKQSREYLQILLKRKDIKQNQLFFMIHPRMDTDQVQRVIMDLGVDEPQIVSSYGSEAVLRYLSNYPITEFIRNAIKIFEVEINRLSEILETENRESAIQNAEIHTVIDSIELQIERLKESERFFAERDNLNAGYSFSVLRSNLVTQITEWRKRKTKIIGDAECAVAAGEYDADIAKYMIAFISAAKDTYKKIAADILALFKAQYAKQGLAPDFIPQNIDLPAPATCQSISLSDEFIALKEITYEDQKYDLMSIFRISGVKEDKEPVRIATCYYSQWREKAIAQVLPLVDKFIENNLIYLNEYYNALAEAFRQHLTDLIAVQETEKSRVSAQLSDDERKLQEDNDWFAQFKEQLIHIERG